MSEQYILFIFFSVLSHVLENLGLGFEKWGVDRMPKAKNKLAKAGWMVIWISGLTMTILVVGVQFKALSLGNASTMGALAGTGLVALTIFSVLVLKEKILKQELFGIFIIMVGTSLLGYFSHGVQKEHVEMNIGAFWMYFAGYVVFLVATGLISKANIATFGSALLGIMSGTLNSTALTIQKIITERIMAFTSHPTLAAAGELMALPYVYIMILCAVGGIVVRQFAYKNGKAVQIVPARASAYILTPLIAGMVFLGEGITTPALAGIIIVVIGVIITTTANPAKHGKHKPAKAE